MVTVGELFDFCEDIELRNAKLYARFMIRLGSDDDRIAQFWEEMSREEWEHHIILNFGRDLCERARMMAEPVRDVARSELEEVGRVVHLAEQRVKTGNYVLHDAFAMAVDSEGSEGDELFLQLVRLIRQAIDRLGEYHLEVRLQRVGRKVHDHLDGLIQAIIRLDDDPELVRRAREALDRHPVVSGT